MLNHKDLADRLHRAAHDGTVDFKTIDEVIAELRSEGAPKVDTELGPALSPAAGGQAAKPPLKATMDA